DPGQRVLTVGAHHQGSGAVVDAGRIPRGDGPEPVARLDRPERRAQPGEILRHDAKPWMLVAPHDRPTPQRDSHDLVVEHATGAGAFGAPLALQGEPILFLT